MNGWLESWGWGSAAVEFTEIDQLPQNLHWKQKSVILARMQGHRDIFRQVFIQLLPNGWSNNVITTYLRYSGTPVLNVGIVIYFFYIKWYVFEICLLVNFYQKKIFQKWLKGCSLQCKPQLRPNKPTQNMSRFDDILAKEKNITVRIIRLNCFTHQNVMGSFLVRQVSSKLSPNPANHQTSKHTNASEGGYKIKCFKCNFARLALHMISMN